VGKGPQYYSVFGQYVLTPEVFTVLKKNIQEAANRSNEINMTDTLVKFINQGLTGVVLEGSMYDIGNPEAYRETIAAFSTASQHCKTN
jgi:UTP-glucose-1-phosphate uridylyltransferase